MWFAVLNMKGRYLKLSIGEAAFVQGAVLESLSGRHDLASIAHRGGEELVGRISTAITLKGIKTGGQKYLNEMIIPVRLAVKGENI